MQPPDHRVRYEAYSDLAIEIAANDCLETAMQCVHQRIKYIFDYEAIFYLYKTSHTIKINFCNQKFTLESTFDPDIKERLSELQEGLLAKKTVETDKTGKYLPLFSNLDSALNLNSVSVYRLPIIKNKEIQAVICVLNTTHELDPLDKKFIKLVGVLLSLHLERIISYSTLQKMTTEINRQHMMASIAQISLSLAHHVNTPLGVSYTAATYAEEILKNMRHKINSPKVSKKYLITSIDEVEKSFHIIQPALQKTISAIEIFKLSGNIDNNMGSHELLLHHLIATAVEESQIDFTKVKLNTTCDTALKIKGPEYYFIYVLKELIRNCLEHNRDNQAITTISITARNHNTDIVLTVEDNGCGIPECLIARMFEPFNALFAGENAGLGLYYCRNILQELFSGTITLEPTTKGALFKIVLPKSQ